MPLSAADRGRRSTMHSANSRNYLTRCGTPRRRCPDRRNIFALMERPEGAPCVARFHGSRAVRRGSRRDDMIGLRPNRGKSDPSTRAHLHPSAAAPIEHRGDRTDRSSIQTANAERKQGTALGCRPTDIGSRDLARGFGKYRGLPSASSVMSGSAATTRGEQSRWNARSAGDTPQCPSMRGLCAAAARSLDRNSRKTGYTR